ncbi:MAG: hypothetical protein M3Q07_26475, partial [Pseudobdellovibrionaceae bacterium]|nr:hypothetical protein [Pseudobdellovibrionaceae bacterium]
GWQTWGPLLSLWNFQWLLSISGASVKPEAKPANRWLDAFFSQDLLTIAKETIFGTSQPSAEAWKNWGQTVWEAARVETDDDEIDEDVDDEDALEEPEEATPEQAAAFIQHTLLHAMRQLHRARWLLRLMECHIIWHVQGKDAGSYRLVMKTGIPTMETSHDVEPGCPETWGLSRAERLSEVDLPMHDRLTILYSGLRKGLRRGDKIRICFRPGLTLDQDELQRYLL